MTTSICHLILFIIPAVALSDLRLPIAGFNTEQCYIMIMSGLGAGMLSASHSGRMKWINIPEGAEIGGLCMCECVDRQPWEIRVHNCSQLQTASFFLSGTHTAVCVASRGAEWATFSGETI